MASEALACGNGEPGYRNFVQLCMEGYYEGLTFHRLVPDFIVQGGDPTGSGLGGDSVFGGPFKDEFHSRLRFSRRGLVGCANGGTKDDNNSQFFFTLGPTPELQGKHTLFGRVSSLGWVGMGRGWGLEVVGDTLFNMLKLGEGGADQNEKPKLPRKILGAEVIDNPFEDIVPRKAAKRKDDKGQRPESKAKATKFDLSCLMVGFGLWGVERNFGLLSFGDEAEEEEEAALELNTVRLRLLQDQSIEKLGSRSWVRRRAPTTSSTTTRSSARTPPSPRTSWGSPSRRPTRLPPPADQPWADSKKGLPLKGEEDPAAKKRRLEVVKSKLGQGKAKKARGLAGEVADDDLEGVLESQAQAQERAKK